MSEKEELIKLIIDYPQFNSQILSLLLAIVKEKPLAGLGEEQDE